MAQARATTLSGIMELGPSIKRQPPMKVCGCGLRQPVSTWTCPTENGGCGTVFRSKLYVHKKSPKVIDHDDIRILDTNRAGVVQAAPVVETPRPVIQTEPPDRRAVVAELLDKLIPSEAPNLELKSHLDDMNGKFSELIGVITAQSEQLTRMNARLDLLATIVEKGIHRYLSNNPLENVNHPADIIMRNETTKYPKKKILIVGLRGNRNFEIEKGIESIKDRVELHFRDTPELSQKLPQADWVLTSDKIGHDWDQKLSSYRKANRYKFMGTCNVETFLKEIYRINSLQ